MMASDVLLTHPRQLSNECRKPTAERERGCLCLLVSRFARFHVQDEPFRLFRWLE